MTTALLLSASRADETGYLEHALPLIEDFLNIQDSKQNEATEIQVLFVPYAGVTISFDDYTHQVEKALSELPLNIKGIHEFSEPKDALTFADVILVGGGNTFALLERLYKDNVISLIREAVVSGTKYIGWSAGSNLAGLTIKTTNDMPITMPPSFNAIGLVPFQINPHYTDFNPPGHHGETRQMRLEEFMTLEPNTTVVGIQEGTALVLQNNSLTLVGNKPGYVFKGGQKQEVNVGENLSDLLGL